MSARSGHLAVWDLPTRVFHWALVVLVAVSLTTGTLGGDWLSWHMRSGYAILALLLFRIAWGFVGSSTARFRQFVRGPRAALAYVRWLASRRGVAPLGHNPLGGWMVLLMLALLAVQAFSGLFADDEIATQGPLAVKVSNAFVERMSALHAWNQYAIWGAIGLHVAAVAFYQLGLRMDLLRPMWRGWRAAESEPEESVGVASNGRAAILLAIAAAFVWWLVVVYPRGAAN